MPTSIGYQDIAALLGHQPAALVSPAHLIASPFGTIEPATFSYGIRPIGTAMPEPPAIVQVNFDPRSLDSNVWSIGEPLSEAGVPPVVYPTVNRKLKGDARQPASPTERRNCPTRRRCRSSTPTASPAIRRDAASSARVRRHRNVVAADALTRLFGSTMPNFRRRTRTNSGRRRITDRQRWLPGADAADGRHRRADRTNGSSAGRGQ